MKIEEHNEQRQGKIKISVDNVDAFIVFFIYMFLVFHGVQMMEGILNMNVVNWNNKKKLIKYCSFNQNYITMTPIIKFFIGTGEH